MGDKGQIYEKGWDGEYHPAEGFFGPKEGEPKIGMLSGEPVPARDFLGNQKHASDGAPLYESSGSGGGEGALVGLIAIVVVIAVVIALIVVAAVAIAVLAAVGWWARGLYRSIRRDRATGALVSGTTLAWAGSGIAVAAVIAVGVSQYRPPTQSTAPGIAAVPAGPAVANEDGQGGQGDPGAAPGAPGESTAPAVQAATFAKRWGAVTVVLADGSVLVVGGTSGKDSKSAVAKAQVYDLASGSWRNVTPMREQRAYPAAARLPDGRILVAGGSRDGAPVATCEIYDPVTDTWSAAPPMSVARSFFDLVTLPDGRLLAAGGGTSGEKHPAAATAEVYDPGSGSWNATGTMNRRRAYAAAASLPDGRVVVAGGSPIYFGKITPTKTSEIWDPRTGTWKPGPSMRTARYYAEMVALGDTLLVAGGWPNDGARTPALTKAELLRAGEAWSPAGAMQTGRGQFDLVALDTDRAVAIGGLTGPNNTVVGTTDLFSLDALSWSAGPSLPAPVMWPAAAAMPDGRILVAGGATDAEGTTTTSTSTMLEVGR